MPQEFFRLCGQVQKLENFSSQTFISVHSHSLRLNCERGVGRGVEEELEKKSEKEKEWGSQEVPGKMPPGVRIVLDTEKNPKEGARNPHSYFANFCTWVTALW